jgi:hypothetical protein
MEKTSHAHERLAISETKRIKSHNARMYHINVSEQNIEQNKQ